MGKKFNVLVICGENIFRSRALSALIRQELKKLGVKDVKICSAGVHTPTEGSYEPLEKLLEKPTGGKAGKHTPAKVTLTSIQNADLILTMGPLQSRKLAQLFGNKVSTLKGKIKTVKQFAVNAGKRPMSKPRIADPKGKSSKVHLKCFREIERISGRVAKNIVRRHRRI